MNTGPQRARRRTQRMSSKSRALLVAGVIVVLFLAGAIAFTIYRSSENDSGGAAPADAASLRAWLNDTAGEFDALRSALELYGAAANATDTASPEPATALRDACRAIERSATSLGEGPAFGEPAIAQQLDAAIALFRAGAADCVRAAAGGLADEENLALYKQAAGQLTSAGTELVRASQLITSALAE